VKVSPGLSTSHTLRSSSSMKGDVDIPKTIRLLEAVGYDGIIHPEHLGVAGAGAPQAEAVSYLKRLVGV